MEQFHDREVEEAVSNQVSSIIEQVLWYVEQERELYRERAMEIIAESDGNEMAASRLTLDQQLKTVEVGVDETGYGDITFSLDTYSIYPSPCSGTYLWHF